MFAVSLLAVTFVSFLLIITIDPIIILFVDQFSFSDTLVIGLQTASDIFDPVLITTIATAFFLLFTAQSYFTSNNLWHSQPVYFCGSVILSFIITGGLKVVLGRYRPELLFEDNMYGFSIFSFDQNHHSFPSGHAAITGTLWFSWYYFYQNRLVLSAITIILILIIPGRLVLGDHFPSDIIFGLFVAYTSAYSAHILYREKTGEPQQV